LASGDRVKLQARKVNGLDTVVVSSGTSLTLIDVGGAKGDPGPSGAQGIQGNPSATGIASIYLATSGALIQDTYITVPFDSQTIVDSPEFTFISGSGIIVNQNGRYVIDVSVANMKVVGDQRANSDIFLNINGINQPGTNRGMFHRNINQGFTSASLSIALVLSAGDLVSVVTRQFAGGGIVATSPSGSSLVIEKK